MDVDVDIDVDVSQWGALAVIPDRAIPEFQQVFWKIRPIFFRKKILFLETKTGNFGTVEPRSTDTHLLGKPAVYNGQFRLSRHRKISYIFSEK